jgi:hypothetical protein
MWGDVKSTAATREEARAVCEQARAARVQAAARRDTARATVLSARDRAQAILFRMFFCRQRARGH